MSREAGFPVARCGDLDLAADWRCSLARDMPLAFGLALPADGREGMGHFPFDAGRL
jgi:hypothetical protein